MSNWAYQVRDWLGGEFWFYIWLWVIKYRGEFIYIPPSQVESKENFSWKTQWVSFGMVLLLSGGKWNCEFAIPVYGKTSSINCGSPTDNFYAKQIYFTKTTKLLHVKFAIEFKNTLFFIFLFQFITSTFNNCTFLLLDEDTNQFLM